MEDVPHETLMNQHTNEESSATVRERVTRARSIACARQGRPNALLNAKETILHTQLTESIKLLFKNASTKLNISARSVHKILRIARTIADLEGVSRISETHILEALRYRRM